MDMEALLNIQDHLQKEITEAKNRLIALEAEILDTHLKKQEELQANLSLISKSSASAPTSTSSSSSSSSSAPMDVATEEKPKIVL